MIASFKQAKHYKIADRKTNDLVVIHDMEYWEKPTGAEWCADFFAAGPKNAKSEPVVASCHFAIDNDSVVQCVLEKDVAWHTPGSLQGRYVNDISIGIEHAGFARQTKEEWLDDYSLAMLELSAELTASLCAKYSIPAVKLSPDDLKAGNVRGVCGHHDCTLATGKGTHWDPGPHFPWSWYMERVRAHLGHILQEPVPVEVTPNDNAAAEDSTVRAEVWRRILYHGTEYMVSPIYIAPVGIGQADDLATLLGCELPTPGLVDMIWMTADLKIDATKMIRTDHDGTLKTMASSEMFASQADRLAKEVGQRSLGKDFQLLAGPFKDVVQWTDEKTGERKVGIYGWYRKDGTIVQPPHAGHARGHIDYSQGLRLVKKVAPP
jgi:N-acetyl-anhydromuramyl-L-alanine amidase AmpD